MKADRFKAWWALRPLREKLMLVAGTLGALLALADALVTAPLEKKVKRTAAETQALDKRLQAARLGGQPDPAQVALLREQEVLWRQRLLTAQGDAGVLRQRVAESARLPETLRAITATVGSARLLELDLSADRETAAAAPSATAALPAASAAGPAGTRATQAAAGLPRLYRLPITLKVSGSYSELHTLLTQFERHAEALQWSSLSLDNSEWPAIQMTLKAHVLSHAPRWGASS